ncbi:MAG: signal peptidase I [Clostridium sp.]|nr:signal peptidase I [Clostridium sp.]
MEQHPNNLDIHSNGEPRHTLTLRERIARTRTTRWIRFAVVSVIFFLWVAWLGTWWVGLFWFLLLDIYILGYIPLTWWKKSKSATTRAIMSWVDAIVYALVLVYFVFAFIGQNYQIPSSSLEKSLLVGDYLWVNKMAYGPRVPMTPVHFPLVQNTFPIINTKSYLDNPQLPYHRLKGFGQIERGDIVVFNFPGGDTVSTKITNPDYYTLVKLYGRERVNNDRETFGEILYRPVDRRENYVKRAVGLPGEMFRIENGVIYNDGVAMEQPRNVQFNYYIQTARPFNDRDWETLGIAVDDRHMLTITPADLPSLRATGFRVDTATASLPILYVSPLTAAMVEQLGQNPDVLHTMRVPAQPGEFLYPEGIADRWTSVDYGEIWIPKKGESIELTPANWLIYGRCIRNYEGNDAELREDGRVWIDGKPADRYTFKMDYYFMMGDNRDNSLDSRYWGFVPEDHIVGQPMRVLISFDKDKSIFNGGIRWNRILKNATGEE